ncbi:hypothetical protein BH10CHL1_BH10CHL1_02300 [soil metagenome]
MTVDLGEGYTQDSVRRKWSIATIAHTTERTSRAPPTLYIGLSMVLHMATTSEAEGYARSSALITQVIEAIRTEKRLAAQ